MGLGLIDRDGGLRVCMGMESCQCCDGERFCYFCLLLIWRVFLLVCDTIEILKCCWLTAEELGKLI